ncbi:MAG: DUF3289 family protein [Saprospiraceae bacterium]|nr:DUF3289 family protein [Saprospiraceae bacterium]
MKNRILLLIAFALLALAGCEKDLLTDVDTPDNGLSSKTLTVQQAKKWWDSRKYVTFRSDEDDILTSNNVTPLWGYAIESRYKGEQDIVLVPFKWNNKLIHLGNRGSINLVIYYDHGLERFATRIMGIIAAESYDRPRSQFSVNDFTGYIFQIDESGDVPWIIQTQNGRMTRQARNDLNGEAIDFRDPDPSRCYSFSRGFLGRLLRDFTSFFEGIGEFVTSAILDCYEEEDQAGGGTDGSDDGPDWPDFGNFGVVNPGPPGDTGPQSGGSFNQYFNNQIFHWTAEHAQLLEQFRVRNNISLPIHVLMLVVNPSCFANPEMSDVPEDGGEDAMYDQCVFWSMVNWVNERASLSPEEYNDLTVNTQKLEDAVAFLLHLEASGFTNGEMESLMDRWFENYGAFDNLEDNPLLCCNKPNELYNGISILSIQAAQTVLPNSSQYNIGGNLPRGNIEDLLSRTNGDDRGVRLGATNSNPPRPYTDDELFLEMRRLFDATTQCDAIMRGIAYNFIETFRTNNDIGRLYWYIPLSEKVKTHPEMRRYIKDFAKQFENSLRASGGQANFIVQMDNDQRPKFNRDCSDKERSYDRYYGYQILINDTEETKVRMSNNEFVYDPVTKNWSAAMYFIVVDHFGLDQGDVLNYQQRPFLRDPLDYGVGFAAWWRLQHTRGYKPFRTQIVIKATVAGNIG